MGSNKRRISQTASVPIISLIFVAFYVMGAYDQFMMLSFNDAYYASKGLGEAAVTYFTGYPLLLLLTWIINIYGSIAAGLLLLVRSKLAEKFALTSLVSIVALEVYTFAFRDRWIALGPSISLFDIVFVAGGTMAFYFYVRSLHSKHLLV